MTIIMCATWLVLFALTAFAFWKGKIFISSPEAILRDQLQLTKEVADDEKQYAVDEERALGDERTMTEAQYAREMVEEPDHISNQGTHSFKI